ncbi:VOC family protein [Nonomuraea sp. NBC_01738]|uniref:VOC family protein n=1 Tax=Nonomuraea sp. NBC_01738 TaxID=2976003 RepID=UPI002E0E1875|nr:VOC family protein [Nonomuraea sp. NBC_01738]
MKLGNVLVPVADLDAAIAFYGLPVMFRDGDRFAALDGGGVTIALCGPDEQVTPGVAVSFKVGDVAAAAKEFTASGASVLSPPQAGPHEWRAVLRDPSGNVFVLYSPL